jgi:hypothetical protein
MRRAVAGLIVAAGGCAVVAVVLVLATIGLLEASGVYRAGSSIGLAPDPDQERLANAAWALEQAVAPLAGGALLAVIAILALLALRRELRRAPAP